MIRTQALLIVAAVVLTTLLFGLPLAAVFTEALRNGLAAIPGVLADPDAAAAIALTVEVAAISVAVNTLFGVAAAWCITKHDFRFRALLVTLIELPLSVSPVISGLTWVLLLGSHGWFGPALQAMHIQVVFATPGIVLATLFVTFPFVVRPLLPLMQEQGRQQEEAATLLGAGLWHIFWRVTLPDIKWALLSGVLLCNARAMGEFGAGVGGIRPHPGRYGDDAVAGGGAVQRLPGGRRLHDGRAARLPGLGDARGQGRAGVVQLAPQPGRRMSIELEGVSKRHGHGAPALDGLTLSVATGEFLVLIGPSGSGKTTALRVIAGLEPSYDGVVRVDGRDLAGLPARARRIGFVFQGYALFRHMTVADNVAFGLRVRPRRERPSHAAIRARVSELLDGVHLGAFGGRYPDQLSGGQRQRVALARALATEPSLLLLDEPFGALDPPVRIEMRRTLRTLHEGLGLTTVLVTHDRDEAFALADRVAVLGAGRIQQIGTPDALDGAPANPFVFEFLGESQSLPGTVRDAVFYPHLHGLAPLPTTLPNGDAVALIRPWEIRLRPGEDAARVVAVRRQIGIQSLTLDLSGTELRITLAQDHAVMQPGDRCGVDLSRARLLPATDRSAAHGATPLR